MLVPTRLVEIHTDGDDLVAHLEKPDGSREEVSATSILMATNGFGANKDMVARYLPEITSAVYHGSDASLGDALRIGESFGASGAYLDAYQGHAAIAVHGATLAGWATIMHGGIMVNTHGERFGNETCGYSEYAAMLAAQPGARGWLILDERVHQQCLAFRDYQETIESGALRQAESPEELAAVLGVDPAVLSRTLHTAADSGPRRGTGPLRSDLFLSNRSLPPTSLLRFNRPFFTPRGGLLVNHDAQVLDDNGVAVPGLFAAGGAAAGISGHGADGYPCR